MTINEFSHNDKFFVTNALTVCRKTQPFCRGEKTVGAFNLRRGYE